MSGAFDMLEDKQVAIEATLAKCTLAELQAIAEGLTPIRKTEAGGNVDEGAPPLGDTKVRVTRIIRDFIDGKTDPTEKGGTFLKLIGLVPSHVATTIADIMTKGPPVDMSGRGSMLESTRLGDGSHLEELLKTSYLKRDFRIDGKIGKGSGCINMISLEGQIKEAKRKGYDEVDIVTAVKRVVVPSEIKTYLDSRPDMMLDEIVTFIGSVTKEKSSVDLFQELTNLVQGSVEDAQSFIMRAMEIRQKCLVASEKPGEVPYDRDILRTIFLRTIRMGLSNDMIKSRLEAIISKDSTIDDGSLIHEANKIASEEAERSLRNRRANPRVGEVNIEPSASRTDGSFQADRRNTQPTDGQQGVSAMSTNSSLHETVRVLAEQMTALTQEVARLRTPPAQSNPVRSGVGQANPAQSGTAGQPTHAQHNSGQSSRQYSGRIWHACDNCEEANTQAACRHCFICGEQGHRFRNCPTN